MWAWARANLGIEWQAFLDYSPEEFELLRDAYLDNLEVDDQRLALLMSLIANACAGRKKGQRAWTAKDFEIDRRGNRKRVAQTVDEQKSILEALTLSTGGRVKKNKTS